MSNTLTKNVVAGTPGVPGVPDTPGYTTPGSPPTPATPAYCIDIPHTGPSYREIVIVVPDPVPPGSGANVKPGDVYFFPVTGPPVTTIEHKCYPAQPGSPGVPGGYVPGVPGIPPIPPTPADYQAGWNASARSIASIVGDGQYKFSITLSSIGVVTGLNDANNGSAYMEMEYAIYGASGTFQVMESGNLVGVSGTFTSSDVFTIQRTGTLVSYYRNSTRLYTSNNASRGIVFVDSSLYFGGDQIVNASISDTVDGALPVPVVSGGLTGMLDGMVSYLSNVETAQMPSILPGIVSDIREDLNRTGSLAAEIPGLACRLSTPDVYALEGVLGSIECYIESGLLEPNFAAIDMTLQTMSGFVTAIVGVSSQLTGVLGGIRGFASNAPPGGYMQVGEPPSTSDPVDPYTGDWLGRSGSQLRMMVGFFVDQTEIYNNVALFSPMVVLPSPMLVNGNILTPGSAVGTVVLPTPPLRVSASFGWQVDAALPALSADYHFEIANVLRCDIDLPLITAQGTGTAGTIFGTPDGYPLLLPPLGAGGKISGESDAQVLLPSLEVAGRIVTDFRMRADVRLPKLRSAGLILTPDSIDPQNPLGRRLQGHVVLPSLRGDLNRLWADLRLPKLRGGGQVVGPFADVVEELRIGYAMNLKTGAVTEYSNYPFRAMARAYDKYWGIGLDGGLYRMSGDTDDTQPIAWEWLSGLNDFGMWGQKGVMAVYIRGVFENGATLTLETDNAMRVYDHTAAGDYKNQQVHRIPLGRGIRSDSLAFGMANPKGGYLELDKVTPEYKIIPRNL